MEFTVAVRPVPTSKLEAAVICNVPPVMVMIPSSNERPPIPCVTDTVTVEMPVAFVPALNTAVSPLTHAPAAPVPSTSFHNVLLASHRPVADPVPEAPAVLPLMSQ